MTKELDVPQLFILLLMSLTRDIIDFKYKDIKIGRLIFAINFIGYQKQCTMKEIRDYLNVKPSTATRQIDKLVDKLKLVKRITSSDDRRNVFLELTSKGIEVYNYHKEVQERTISDMFSSLKPVEIQTLVKVVEKILKQDSVISIE